jgi:hypothetical protein
MKKLCILAALLLVLAPLTALAGMSAVSNEDLQDVTGRVGITLSMTMNVTASSFAWGDDDGFGTYTTDGWVILSGLSLPTIQITGITIDAGTTTGGTSYLCIGNPGGGNVVTGTLTIGDLIIGSTANSTTQSIGEVTVNGIGISFDSILISGH